MQSRSPALSLSLRDKYQPAAFRWGVNTALREILARPANVWIYGEEAVGKTHAAYVALSQYTNGILIDDPHYDLSGGDAFDCVILDSMENWIGVLDLEKQVFELFELLHRHRKTLITTARGTVYQQQFVMPDLKSRMATLQMFHLQPLPSSERMGLIEDIAASRGLRIPKEAVSYIFKYVGRSHADVIQTLDLLDAESVCQNRRITIPFVKEVLNL